MRMTIRIALAALATLAATVLLGSGSAAAKSTIYEFSLTPSETQAGGHPDIVARFALGTRFNQDPVPCECNDPKDVTVHAPAGVIANPSVVSICTQAQLATTSCPADSQVGFFIFRVFDWIVVPIYQVTPQAGQAALLAIMPISGFPVYTAVNGRTGGDYGLDLRIKGISHAFTPPSFINVIWGVPGDPDHDILRLSPGQVGIGCNSFPLAEMLEDKLPEDCEAREAVPSSLPVAPYTEGPTSCVGPQTATIDVLAYDGEETHAEAPWPATTGCDKLSFNPSLAATPTTSEADSASGLAIDLKVPQFQDPNTPSPAEIKANTVTLPKGFTINPSAADGKTFCIDQQAKFGTEEAAECPENAKIGTTKVETASLPGPIYGYVYLGQPLPGDRYRVILTASGFGTNVKVKGSTHPDPDTGQIVTSFPDLPQAPFQRYDLHFFGSERGLFATPTQCGTYEVKSTFTPWAKEISDQTSIQFFEVDSGPGGTACPNGPRPFAPRLEAGAQDNTAGVHSPFTLQLRRQDGEQNLSGLTVKTPPGLSATLAGVPYCPEASIAQLSTLGYTGLMEQANPACPAQSQVGTAIAGAGAGTHPVYVPGRAYLAGPYKGAPLSLVVVIPALSGPYDLGVVSVRAALQVDPETARVTAVSDPLPRIIEGVPLRTRFVRIALDRAGFALNPTNCDPFAVGATLSGEEGGLFETAAPFQVANCADLGFSPKLRLRFAGSTRRGGNPALSTSLAPNPGDANFKSARVLLPKAEFIDNDHLNGPCTRVQFAADECPATSVLGTARATSPLLAEPLEGPVYMRSNPERELPDVVADLHGQLDVLLVGHTDQAKGRIRSTFEGLPDVPVSGFSLRLAGAAKGLLENSENLCAKVQKALVVLTGQNGKRLASNTRIKVAGCKGRASKRHRRAKVRRAAR